MSFSAAHPSSFLKLVIPLFLSCSIFFYPSSGWSKNQSFISLRDRIAAHQGASGAYVLEKGDEALLVRSWMVNNAEKSIDILTFIWSLDNIGMIATDSLLRAAERGVQVRAVVDDMVLKKEDVEILLALSLHPNFEIRIYNPVQTVGVSMAEMVVNVLTDFRRFNQRLHNKTFLVDSLIGLTGGRNVANEYFDHDQEYNFLDRDIMVAGPVAGSMQDNFEIYWRSELSRPIEELLPARRSALDQDDLQALYEEVHECAERLLAQIPLAQSILEEQDEKISRLLKQMVWTEDIWFVSDLPVKNIDKQGLGGGSIMADAVAEAIAEAREEIVLQMPYLIFEGEAYGLFEKLRQGIEVRISTNSLASTDNIAAFSGYWRQRQELLDAGFLIREFNPQPAIEPNLAQGLQGPGKSPIFVLHAKSLIIDGELLYIGTFNIDPRSAHLNTEEGIFVRNRQLAQLVEKQIVREMMPWNSWDPRVTNPNAKASWGRRFKLNFYRILPIVPLL